MKAIILVAGYATRLYPLTINTPKALLPINNKPMINYIVEQLNTIKEIDEIYVVSNNKFYTHFNEWAETVESNIKVKVLDDGTTSEENRRGAIGDIQFTISQEKIDDDVIIIAGDNYFTFDLKDYYNYYKNVNKDCVIVKEHDDKEMLKQFAVALLDENNKVTDLEEKPESPKSNTAVYAAYIYKKDTIQLFKKYLDEGNKPDAPGYFVQWLYKIKDVHAYKIDGECYDVGTPKSYEEVKNLFL